VNRRELPLETLQQWMLTAIAHPGGIRAGLDAAQRATGIHAEHLSSLISPSQWQSSAERLAVYNDAYFARLLACMAELFPATAELLGLEAFQALAARYLVTHPPTSYSLHHLPDAFEAHLQSRLPDDDPLAICVLDMLRLERAIDRVFDGPGLEEQTLVPLHEKLASVQLDELLASRLVLHPSLQILELRSAVSHFYTQFRKQQRRELPAIFNAPESLALIRRHYIVQRVPLSPAEHLLIRAAQQHPLVSELLEHLGELAESQQRDHKLAEMALSELRPIMARLAETGVFCDLHFQQRD